MTIHIYRPVPILAVNSVQNDTQANSEPHPPKESEKKFAMGPGAVFPGGKCSKWNEILRMNQTVEKVENNGALMHRITVELRKKHTTERVKSVDIVFDGKMAAKKVGKYQV